MPKKSDSPIAQNNVENALKTLSELSRKYPEKSRETLLREVELKFDLSPLECEFLNRHFA